MLNRNISSHPTDSSAKLMHSTGTDGSYVQSDDGNVNLGDYPDIIDMNVFEQVGVVRLEIVNFKG